MARTRSWMWMMVAAAGLAMPLTVQAQEGQPARSSKVQPTPEEQLRLAEARAEEEARRAALPRIKVEFPGGTVREYIDALRESTKEDRVNIVAPAGLLSVKLGQLSLQNVTVETAVRALEWAVEPRAILMTQFGPNTYGLSDRRAQQPGMPTPQDDKAEVQVMSLRDLIEPLPGDPEGVELAVPADVVLTAIRAALEADAAPEQADLKFHGDSGLLIIRGSRGQIQAAASVLGQIGSDIMRRRSAAKQIQTVKVDLDALRGEAEKQQVRTQYLTRALEQMSVEYEQVQQAHRAGSASPDDVASVRARIDKARAELDTAKIDLNMARAQVAAAERKAADGAAKQKRPGEEGLGDFPAGRSVVTYATSAIEEKDLEGAGAALKALAERIYGKQTEVSIRVQGDTLVVTADQDSQRLIRRALIDASNHKGRTFVQKTAPKPVDEQKAAPAR